MEETKWHICKYQFVVVDVSELQLRGGEVTYEDSSFSGPSRQYGCH